MRQLHGQIGTAQIGTPDGADHQRTPGEQTDRPAVSSEQVGMMVRGVARCGDRGQRDAVGDLNAFAVGDGVMVGRQP